MQGIKNIIFDLGNVILDIDYQLTIDAFKELGITNFQEHFSQYQQSAFLNDFETGKVSEHDFIQYALSYCNKGTTAEQVIHAWNALLLDFPITRLRILQQLELDYDLFLLSNTNIIHEKAYNQSLQELCGYNNLSYFFRKIYLSHKVGLRKPDPEIFLLVLNENKLKAEETLFIDDSSHHIEAAKKLNIQCIHLLPEMSIEKDVFKIKS